MTSLLSLPSRAPRLTLLLMLGLTIWFGFFARSLRVDSSIENLLDEDDPELVYLHEVKRLFVDDEIIVIGVFADDVFAPATLAQIDELSQRLSRLDGVREVISLTTLRGAEMTDAGLHTGQLLQRLPRTAEEAAAFRAKVLSEPLYLKHVVAPDGRATAINVTFEPMNDEEFLQRGLEDQIQALVAAIRPGLERAITGVPTVKVHGARLMEQDTARFAPLSLLLTVVVLVAVFHSVRGVLLPLATVVTGVVWTLGIMVLNGAAINMGTLVLTPLLLVVGIASGIHVVTQYYLELQPGRTPKAVVRATMAHVSLPVAIAGLTTLIGFGALIFTPIRAVREFGLYAVVGIVAILLASFTIIPAALTLLPPPARVPPVGGGGGRLKRRLERVGEFSVRHQRGVLIGGAVILALSLWGISRVRIETSYLTFFPPDSEVRRANDLISTRLAGTQGIYVIIEGEAANAATRLPVLAALRELQDFVDRQPGVDKTVSLLDYLDVVRRVLGLDANARLPATQDEVDQLLLLVNPADVRAVATSDYARLNLIVRSHLDRSSEVQEFVERVRAFAEERFPRGFRIHPTGDVVVLNQSADTLAWGQVTGLWQELLVLLALLSLLFLSLRAGILALVPNVVPTIILFGIMGWFGISLNVSTSMIAAIAIGIAIDDTVHLLTAFNNEARHTGNQEEAAIRAVSSAGQAAVFISLALAAGFFIVCLSNFQPVRHFGLLSGVTMGVALVTELLFTPALLTVTKLITLWDLLLVRLGPEPHKHIPLLAGLRPLQARIVVLMARMAEAAQGQFIARTAEQSNALYVLLSGRAEVRTTAGRVLQTLSRGDIAGEMGVIRQRPRSADIVAVEDTEFLILDEAFLRRLPRRYPRTASKVLLNLSRVLSDRLEHTTQELARSEQPAATRRQRVGP